MKSTSRKLWMAMMAVSFAVLSTLGCSTLSGILATATPTATNTPIPTNTPLPTDTPTPLPTDTPTPLPTDTPVPTDTPAVVETKAPVESEVDLSAIVLTEGDLPSFIEIPAEQLGVSSGQTLGNEDFKIESAFALVDQTTAQVLFGFTTYIPGVLEQTGFDIYIKNPELLGDAFVQGMGGNNVIEQKALEVTQVGDSTGAVTVLVDMNGVKMRVDMLIFRQGPVGVFLVNLYMDSVTPTTSVEDAAQMLSKRISEKLP